MCSKEALRELVDTATDAIVDLVDPDLPQARVVVVAFSDDGEFAIASTMEPGSLSHALRIVADSVIDNPPTPGAWPEF